jgi:hypothetical protein
MGARQRHQSQKARKTQRSRKIKMRTKLVKQEMSTWWRKLTDKSIF